MSGPLSDNDDVMNAVMRAVRDPDQITPRAPLEDLYSWKRRAVIEHAAPLIAAAERERIRDLATEYRAVYRSGNWEDGVESVPFADLLGGES